MFDGYNADAVFYSVYSVKKKTFTFSYMDEGGRWQIIWQDNFSNGYRRCKSGTYLKQQMAR